MSDEYKGRYIISSIALLKTSPSYYTDNWEHHVSSLTELNKSGIGLQYWFVFARTYRRAGTLPTRTAPGECKNCTSSTTGRGTDRERCKEGASVGGTGRRSARSAQPENPREPGIFLEIVASLSVSLLSLLSLVASLSSWRCLATSTSSFLHAAINLLPPPSATVSKVAFQSPAMPNARMSLCTQSVHSFFYINEWWPYNILINSQHFQRRVRINRVL